MGGLKFQANLWAGVHLPPAGRETLTLVQFFNATVSQIKSSLRFLFIWVSPGPQSSIPFSIIGGDFFGY